MVFQTRSMTVKEFDQSVLLSENKDRNFEYIGGEVIEGVSNPVSSNLAARVTGFLFVHLTQNDIGYLTSSDGVYIVSGERYIPDVGFITYAKQPTLDYFDGYIQNPPDLAVEVLSPGNEDDDMAIKIANYLAAKTVVWLLKPLQKQVVVFKAGQPALVLGMDAVLDGGDVLPGFSLKVADIFAQQK
jgi:Uma2 family endonuclease